jgi:hypothetical protein
VCENRVLTRIFGPQRYGVIRGWRTLHYEELHNLYSSKNIIRMVKSRRIRLAGSVTSMDRKGKVEGNRSLRRPRRRLKDISTDHRDIGWGGVY